MNYMLPFTLHQLRILKAIATEKSFTNASKMLYLSQSSLSKQLKILEDNLEILLVHRERNNVTLTKHGKVFLDYAERILSMCEESCRVMNELKNFDRGDLKIGASEIVGTYLMPKMLVSFRQSFSGISFNLQTQSTEMTAKKILKNELDIAIVGGEISDKLKQKLTIQPFGLDKLSLIISKNHPLALKKKIKKNDLYSLNFITFNLNSDMKKFLDDLLVKNQIKTEQLKIILQLNSTEAIKIAVSLGLGAAFVSSLAIKKEVKLKKFEVIKIANIPINRKLFIISNPKNYKKKSVKLFLNHVKKFKTEIEN